jgi:hypothetical protein
MNAAVVGVLISIIALPLLMGYLKISSLDDRNNVERYFTENEYFVIKYSKKYQIIGFMSILASFVCIIIQSICLADIKDSESAIAFFSLISSFFLLGITIVLIVHNTKIELFDDRIVYSNLFNLSKEIYWHDIKKVEYSKDLSYIAIKTENVKIKVSTEMPDYDAVIVRIVKKLDKSLYKGLFKIDK